MKRISLEDLLHSHKDLSYTNQYSHIRELLESGKIKPLKASGTNGKKPMLYREYWLIEKQKDYTVLEEELKYQLSPAISVDYYLSHLDTYEQDRRWILRLDEYLRHRMGNLEIQESVNERSYEIWNREKFLTKEQGKRILKQCGLDMSFLNIYGTTEPLAYYSHTREVPQNLLILENKDTFYSMRRNLLEGKNDILGIRIGTIIYGAGKRVLRSFQDFGLCVEPYMEALENRIYYFGDLDYEGIGIYESLDCMTHEKWRIIPFVEAYEAMLKKAGIILGEAETISGDAGIRPEDSGTETGKTGTAKENAEPFIKLTEAIENLPDTKEQQNRNIQETFFSYFSKASADRMKKILESDKYIPQEILNITDF